MDSKFCEQVRGHHSQEKWACRKFGRPRPHFVKTITVSISYTLDIMNKYLDHGPPGLTDETEGGE